MSRTLRSSVSAVLALGIISIATPALASGKGGGEIGNGRVVTWISVQSDGTFTAPAGFHLRYSFEGTHPSCTVDEGRWREWLYYGDDPARGQLIGDDILVKIPGGDGIGLVGGAYGLELINPGPKHGDVTRPFCGPPPVPDLDIWDAASKALPRPNLVVNPSPIIDGHPTGVTGMEIWLWFDPGAPGWDPPETTVSVTATAGGFTTRVDAWIAAVRWNFDNGDEESIGFIDPGATGPPPASHYEAVSGTEERPARTYTYESKGAYVLSIDVIWTGTFELFDAAGGSLGVYPLDAYADSESIDYHVIEIRSVLTK
jgi:hypothetical protein